MSAADTSTTIIPIAKERWRANDEAAVFDELRRDTHLLGLLTVVSQTDPPLDAITRWAPISDRREAR